MIGYDLASFEFLINYCSVGAWLPPQARVEIPAPKDLLYGKDLVYGKDLGYRKDFLRSGFFVETEHASKKTLSVNSFCVDFVTTFRYRKDFFYWFFRHLSVFRIPFGNLLFVL